MVNALATVTSGAAQWPTEYSENPYKDHIAVAWKYLRAESVSTDGWANIGKVYLKFDVDKC